MPVCEDLEWIIIYMQMRVTHPLMHTDDSQCHVVATTGTTDAPQGWFPRTRAKFVPFRLSGGLWDQIRWYRDLRTSCVGPQIPGVSPPKPGGSSQRGWFVTWRSSETMICECMHTSKCMHVHTPMHTHISWFRRTWGWDLVSEDPEEIAEWSHYRASSHLHAFAWINGVVCALSFCVAHTRSWKNSIWKIVLREDLAPV